MAPYRFREGSTTGGDESAGEPRQYSRCCLMFSLDVFCPAAKGALVESADYDAAMYYFEY